MINIIQPKIIMEKLSEYAQKPFGYLILSGPNGRGKSFAAKEIYHRNTPYVLPQHSDFHAVLIKQATLNTRYLDSLGGHNLEELSKKFIDTKLLVLDDLGSRDPSPGFLDFIYMILDERYEGRKTKGTIITTNLGHAELRSKFGEAIASRITSGINLRIDGHEDRRLWKDDREVQNNAI